HIGPSSGASDHLFRISTVCTNLPHPRVLRLARGINDPTTIGSGNRVLGVNAIMADLSRRGAVAIRHPDFKVAGSIGTPQEMLIVGCNVWIPVRSRVVCEPLQGSAFGRHFPEVDITAA